MQKGQIGKPMETTKNTNNFHNGNVTWDEFQMPVQRRQLVNANTLASVLKDAVYNTIPPHLAKLDLGAIGTPWGRSIKSFRFEVNIAGHAAGASSEFILRCRKFLVMAKKVRQVWR